MERYYLFAGMVYYPGQGWDDFEGSFETIEGAVQQAQSLNFGVYSWFQVVDGTTGVMVRRFEETV